MVPPGGQRAQCWQLRTRTLPIGKVPLLMGIINVTPDSFSDGGQFLRGTAAAAPGETGGKPPFSNLLDPGAAVAYGLQLAAEGADILDIGGQSTRPGSLPVSTEEELRRVLPVLSALRAQTSLPISLDTSKAAVARAALEAGAEVINDVTALTGDPEMLPLVAETGCGVCLMHMQGDPRTMQQAPAYGNVVEEVWQYLRARRDALLAAGISQERIALDPGIGFGKTTEHNLALLGNAWRLHALGCPVLVGHSRKRFIAQVLGEQAVDRRAGTIGVALALARQGVQILRVHDVAPVRQALHLYEASGGLR
jgi:dihydropteroate synthase